MYLPSPFAESRVSELHRLMREHPLGMLVTHGHHGLDANHLPCLLDSDGGPFGTLTAHVARANPVWREIAEGASVLVVFRGAQGYISPNWYPSKQETHRQVPTWNYEVVHAHGTVHVRDDEKFVRGLVARLTREHESRQPTPWKMGDAPADFIADELRQIVGIEVRITRLEGKRKLDQHQEPGDREGAISGLERCGNPALARAMKGG
ncbi:FMN-binding negative transcriptional regulator [Roseateles chitosanitabidus]|uniref:FMN-binding negative transcriptional regulator n=1 Tax=Roseateles chitosanitabidus TaxID=65048 RepID=UPI000832EA9B|nr:FMN-binding negative transcriptional regulator [Roseateles chitosanitabidus]